MKKKLLGLFLVCAMLLTVGFVVKVHAEGEEPVVTYTSSVVVNGAIEHGKVAVNTVEGNAGDIVTVTVEPDILYVIDAVYANGTQILTNEDGLYQFALVEGENTVNAKFVINNEALETITELVEKAKDEGFDSLFQPKNIILLIFALLSLLEGTGLIVVVNKLKKAAPVADELAAKTVEKAVEEKFMPIVSENKELTKTLTKCFILSQENTPEARLKIVDELTKVQNNNQELANQVVSAINDAIEKAKEVQNDKIKALDELEQANNNLTNKNAENGQNNGNVGRY